MLRIEVGAELSGGAHPAEPLSGPRHHCAQNANGNDAPGPAIGDTRSHEGCSGKHRSCRVTVTIGLRCREPFADPASRLGRAHRLATAARRPVPSSHPWDGRRSSSCLDSPGGWGHPLWERKW